VGVPAGPQLGLPELPLLTVQIGLNDLCELVAIGDIEFDACADSCSPRRFEPKTSISWHNGCRSCAAEARVAAELRRLDAAVRDLGLPIDCHHDTKTQRVLASLARIPTHR
jgi:hypothetical protein